MNRDAEKIAPAAPPADSANKAVFAPISLAERNKNLDVLRGFALLGILLVNIAHFSQPVYELMMLGPLWSTPLEAVVDFMIRFFAEGKSYSLFAFLFGLGMTIQMERAEARGVQFPRFYARRLLILLGIGLSHAFLIWDGDILFWYALCGFLLLPFRNRKPRTILIWAVISLLTLPVLCWSGLTLVFLVSEPAEFTEFIEQYSDEADHYRALAEKEIQVFGHGSYADIFAHRAKNVPEYWMYGALQTPAFFAMCLAGMYVGRRRILQSAEKHFRAMRRACVWGLAVGIPANVVYAVAVNMGSGSDFIIGWFVAITALAFGAPAFCLFYVCGTTLLLHSERWTRRLQPIAAAGRMALTNYLLQSVICTTVFYGYGLSLYGSMTCAAVTVLAMIIYVAQVRFSIWYLDRFQIGPVEWLWRALAYRRSRTQAAVATSFQ